MKHSDRPCSTISHGGCNRKNKFPAGGVMFRKFVPLEGVTPPLADQLAGIARLLFCCKLQPDTFCQYTVTVTIGQADAGGAMTGGNYSLTGGFWSLIAVAQSPGAPTLYISRSGSIVTVYWQNVSGWSLQQNNNLALPANWSASGGVSTTNGTNNVNITPPTGNLFFRLANPLNLT